MKRDGGEEKIRNMTDVEYSIAHVKKVVERNNGQLDFQFRFRLAISKVEFSFRQMRDALQSAVDQIEKMQNQLNRLRAHNKELKGMKKEIIKMRADQDQLGAHVERGE